MKPASLLLALAALAACTSAIAAGIADDVTAVGPFVRMAPPGAQATGAFMVLKNKGGKDARIVGASSPAAKIVELHEHIDDGGVMKMRPVPSIIVKANGETVLKPGGLHVMLIGLTAPMNEGEKVAITLHFDDGSSRQVDATLMKPAPMPAAPSPMEGHKH